MEPLKRPLRRELGSNRAVCHIVPLFSKSLVYFLADLRALFWFRVLGIGETPPPCWEKFPNNPVFFLVLTLAFMFHVFLILLDSSTFSVLFRRKLNKLGNISLLI